ncbi:hypothetical protein GEV33_007906 [Tenebrio molitor]|uniref:Uncharacterized protein n=1 Tax=Tenebrio molitor TaxID=7067 RepID=A0A8J6HA16_TENMO|nr:hypothetical protein GEV33_007906 [Tenebrio molitor]
MSTKSHSIENRACRNRCIKKSAKKVRKKKARNFEDRSRPPRARLSVNHAAGWGHKARGMRGDKRRRIKNPTSEVSVCTMGRTERRQRFIQLLPSRRDILSFVGPFRLKYSKIRFPHFRPHSCSSGPLFTDKPSPHQSNSPPAARGLLEGFTAHNKPAITVYKARTALFKPNKSGRSDGTGADNRCSHLKQLDHTAGSRGNTGRGDGSSSPKLESPRERVCERHLAGLLVVFYDHGGYPRRSKSEFVYQYSTAEHDNSA